MMTDNPLEWLQSWYLNQCNGDWEHQYGVEIGTLDNPGWRVEIDLRGTGLERAVFEERKVDRSEMDWFVCSVEGEKFKAASGPLSLIEVLGIFRNWVLAQASGEGSGKEAN